ncbi:flagellar basal body rod protein FlgB [Thermobrachium celere]|uniref:Flagellar basal body rod protein FlgB n=1 Tax=Thermobrachium celere DSM 8682 TaxID=941824 RepID=R7RPT4_9CLOT|nr:flagellar basal body rod protein FlgB [Thermobrachium celere]CDF58024.1 Flagellar basal-body rod protein FlgB [Thermobrachium celere DSM 8682]
MANSIDNISYILIKKSLDASSERARAIAHNISNVNTPGYKANRVIFEEKVKGILENSSIFLKTTNKNHIGDSNNLKNLTHTIKKDNSKSMRLDGNNVDIDLEMANLAANQILYNALISQANTRIAMRRSVINAK